MFKAKNLVILLVAGCFLKGCTSKQSTQPQLKQLDSPTTSLLQAISFVDANTVWISGHNATFVRSKDAGKSWDIFQHPTGDTLQFRDIHAFDENRAILMSAGPGPLSRILIFESPNNWKEGFVMKDSLGFLDCIDFWDSKRGIAYGDAIDDYPYLLLTKDGGKSWQRADTTKLPKAGKGEGGFAASGTCVTTGKNGTAWIATGAGGNARVLFTEDYGAKWRSIYTPMVKGDAAGHTSISFIELTGFVVGGDLLQPDAYTDNCAFSEDGGQSWRLASQPNVKGAFYGGALTKDKDQFFAFACGPKGLDYTIDFGASWTTLDTLNYWAVSFYENIGYATGTDGKILKISLR